MRITLLLLITIAITLPACSSNPIDDRLYEHSIKMPHYSISRIDFPKIQNTKIEFRQIDRSDPIFNKIKDWQVRDEHLKFLAFTIPAANAVSQCDDANSEYIIDLRREHSLQDDTHYIFYETPESSMDFQRLAILGHEVAHTLDPDFHGCNFEWRTEETQRLKSIYESKQSRLERIHNFASINFGASIANLVVQQELVETENQEGPTLEMYYKLSWE